MDKLEYKMIKIQQNCGLQPFFEETLQIPFSRGCSYYEFKNKNEDIDKDTKIILVKEVCFGCYSL